MNEVIPGYSDLPLSDVKLQQWLLKHLLLKAACYSGSERRAPAGSNTHTHIPNIYSHLTKTVPSADRNGDTVVSFGSDKLLCEFQERF